MKATPSLTSILSLVCLLGSLSTALAQDITGFTALEVRGRCQVIQDGSTAPLEIGKIYPFGTTLETERRSMAKLQFSNDNVFQLLARTRLTITEDANNPKLKILQLQKGQVDLTLDQFPDDHELQVETPTAVCGAVGTRFVVSFEQEETADGQAITSQRRQSSFSCDKGEVFVASRFSVGGTETTGDTMDVPSMTAGSALVATIHEGLENSYTDITVNRGSLTFEYGGDAANTFLVEPTNEDEPTRFICALEKSDSAVDMAALEVTNGSITNQRPKRFLGFIPAGTEETAVSADDGPVVVKDQKVLKEEPPEEDEEIDESERNLTARYLAAAKTEGELHSEWIDVTSTGRAAPQLEERVKEAAAEATSLRDQLTTLRRLRTLSLIRRSGARSARPNVRP